MKSRAKTKVVEKSALAKPAIARLVSRADIDDDAEERQRVGIQSLGVLRACDQA